MSERRSTGRWHVEHLVGPASDLHHRDVDVTAVLEGGEVGRTVWWLEVDRPTVVLGSTQPDDVLVPDRPLHLSTTDPQGGRGEVGVTRRRSGGGAVWLAPGEVTWVDVIVPAGDPLWDDDVSRAGLWLGRAWVRALTRLGAEGLTVHDGAMAVTEWSKLVCFAGRGPGEVVTADGRKIVGISQRRTRRWARFQCAVLHLWDPDPLVGLLDLSDAERRSATSAVIDAAVGLVDLLPGPPSARRVVTALVEELP